MISQEIMIKWKIWTISLSLWRQKTFHANSNAPPTPRLCDFIPQLEITLFSLPPSPGCVSGPVPPDGRSLSQACDSHVISGLVSHTRARRLPGTRLASDACHLLYTKSPRVPR